MGGAAAVGGSLRTRAERVAAARLLRVERAPQHVRKEGLCAQLVRLGEALELVALEQTREQLTDRLGRGAGERRELAVQDLVDQPRLCRHQRRVLGEGRLSREHLEEDDPERPPIGRDRVALASQHLGRGGEGRADDGAAAASAAAAVRPTG